MVLIRGEALFFDDHASANTFWTAITTTIIETTTSSASSGLCPYSESNHYSISLSLSSDTKKASHKHKNPWNVSRLPASQARERLLSKVKADQERLKQLDARTAETTQLVATMKQRIEDLESDLQADRTGDVAQNKVMGDECVMSFSGLRGGRGGGVLARCFWSVPQFLSPTPRHSVVAGPDQAVEPGRGE